MGTVTIQCGGEGVDFYRSTVRFVIPNCFRIVVCARTYNTSDCFFSCVAFVGIRTARLFVFGVSPKTLVGLSDDCVRDVPRPIVETLRVICISNTDSGTFNCTPRSSAVRRFSSPRLSAVKVFARTR